MDLRKLIDENVECVDTPNGKYLNREQVFESIKLVEEKLTPTNKSSFQFPTLEEVVKQFNSRNPDTEPLQYSMDYSAIERIYNFIVGNKKH